MLSVPITKFNYSAGALLGLKWKLKIHSIGEQCGFSKPILETERPNRIERPSETVQCRLLLSVSNILRYLENKS